MNRVFKALAIAFTVVVALVSCKKEDQPKEVALTGIELNATSQTLQVGQEFQLTVTYKPENATNKPAATWASDTPAVATVDGGKVVAVAAGTAKITATVGTFKAECAVTVVSAEEEILPVEGNSEWSLIGALLDANWDKDYVAAKDGDIYVVKNVKLAASNQFKFRKDKDWAENRGATGDTEPFVVTTGTALDVVHNGKNLAVSADGIYDIYYNAAVEQMCIVAKDGTPTWGEKQPEPDNFDYTPGAEYLAEDNLWKGTDEQGANFYIINNINDKGEESSEAESQGVYKFTHEQSTYAMHYDVASSGDWQRLIFLYPNDNAPVAIQEGSLYSGKISFYANKDIPRVFLKVVNCQTDKANREGGNRLFEVNPIPGVKAGEPTVIEFKDIEADFNADNITLVMDFGGAPADVNIYIKDIIIKKTGEAQVVDPDPIPGFDFTPSAEYLAETNLWKPAQETAIICKNDNPGAASSYKDVTVEQSTFMFALRAATPGDWANVWFVYPDADHPVALDREKQYKVKATFASNLANPRVFFKLCASQPDKANHEGVCIYEEIKTLPAGELVTFESEPFYGKPKWADQDQGQTIDDIAFTLDFGGNQANSLIYLKDIIIEEVNIASVSDAIATADNTAIELGESLVVAKCVRGIIVTDGSKYLYAYGQDAVANVKVGDKVTMKGTKKTYNGVPEIDGISDLVVTSSGNAVAQPAAKDITSIVESYESSEAEYVSFSGTLAKSGNYYNINFDGTNAKVGSIQYPAAEMGADAYDGKRIIVTGYFNGLSGGGKYVNVVATNIVDLSKWADITGAEGTGGYNAAFKVMADSDYMYFYVKRTTNRLADLWGGAAYHYYAFDTDGDPSTDVDLWGNKADILLVVYPYAGSSSAPAFGIAQTGSTLPDTSSVANAVISGVVTDSGVETVVAIPRADIAGLPSSFNVTYWSNKGGSEKLTVPVTL